MTKSPKKHNKTTIYLHFHTNTTLRFIRVCVFYRRLERLEYMANKHIGVQSIIRELNSLAGAHSRSRSICELYGTEMQTYTWKMAISIAAAAWKPTDSPFRWFGDVCFASLSRIVASPRSMVMRSMETQTESFDPHNRRTTIHAATNSVKTVKYQQYI